MVRPWVPPPGVVGGRSGEGAGGAGGREAASASEDRTMGSGMSIGERVRREAREIGLGTLYFLVCFGVFLTLKKLLLEEYHVSIYVFHAAVIGALVVAKVVVLLEKTSFGDRFRNRSLIAHALWRSLAYTAVVLVVTVSEHLVEASLAKGSLATALAELWAGKDFDHLLATNLCVALSFLLYNTFAELDRRLGRGSLRRLLFSTQAAEGSGASVRDHAMM